MMRDIQLLYSVHGHICQPSTPARAIYFASSGHKLRLALLAVSVQVDEATPPPGSTATNSIMKLYTHAGECNFTGQKVC